MICELCGSSEKKLITTKIREGYGRIVECCNCGLIYQDTDYSRDDIESYYNNDYCVTNSLSSGEEQNAQEHFDSRMITMKPVYERISKAIRQKLSSDKNPMMLELGCGTGELLQLFAKDIMGGVGVELCKKYVDWANDNLEDNLKFIAQDINTIDFEEKFDVIISNYTIDHLTNPRETLVKLYDILKDDGILYLELPNRDEALNYYLSKENEGKYQTFAWHKAHMTYFTKDTIVKFLDVLGFESNITCIHNYSFRNFLNWYYLGRPEDKYSDAVNSKGLYLGHSDFEMEMNNLFDYVDERFKEIMSDTWSGDTLCIIARKKNAYKKCFNNIK